MSVHRVRLCYSVAGAESFHGWLGTWLTNMSPWDADEVTNGVPTETTTALASDAEWYQVELAFDWAEDKAIIVDQLDGYLGSYCDWHRLGYHVCTHDEDNPSPCSWDTDSNLPRESGAVPDRVPALGGGA